MADWTSTTAVRTESAEEPRAPSGVVTATKRDRVTFWHTQKRAPVRNSTPSARYAVVWVCCVHAWCAGRLLGELFLRLSTRRCQVTIPRPGKEGTQCVCWGLTRCGDCGVLWNRANCRLRPVDCQPWTVSVCGVGSGMTGTASVTTSNGTEVSEPLTHFHLEALRPERGSSALTGSGRLEVLSENTRIRCGIEGKRGHLNVLSHHDLCSNEQSQRCEKPHPMHSPLLLHRPHLDVNF